jgi:hypothetical protein
MAIVVNGSWIVRPFSPDATGDLNEKILEFCLFLFLFLFFLGGYLLGASTELAAYIISRPLICIRNRFHDRNKWSPSIPQLFIDQAAI